MSANPAKEVESLLFYTILKEKILKTKEEKEEFYNKCADIVQIEHHYKEPAFKRNRWTTRNLGNGRFPGFGLIQCFGSSVRVVSKHGTKMFKTYEETYEYLNDLFNRR